MGRTFAALMRHGDFHRRDGAPSAMQPFPLNADGHGHAEAGTRELIGLTTQKGWAVSPDIDCSTLLRAWQTATDIANLLGTTWRRDFSLSSFDALAERGVGSAANLTVAEIEAVVAQDPRYDPPPPNWKSDSHYRLPLPGAESHLEAGRRVAEHIYRRLPGTDEDAVATIKIFVGHGASFRHAAHHLGVLALEDVAGLSMYHGRPVILERRVDGSWIHAAGHWKVRTRANNAMD